MQQFYSRRFVLTGGATLAALAAVPGAAFAVSSGQAKSHVENLVADINRVIDSGKSESGMIQDFSAIFARYSDRSYIAAYALGADGRSATTAQKKAFSAAFSDYVARKYGKRFRNFIGGKLEVNGVKKVKNAFQVSTTAYMRGEAPFEVTFFVGEKSGLFYNMYIEGVNMLLTERTEIGAMLDRRRGDLDAMIADLKRAG